MGYCISMREARFHITDEENALAAVKRLMSDPTANHGGFSSSSSGRTTFFAWMNNAQPDEWLTIDDALADWRYPIERDDEGHIFNIDFYGEKIGDEDQLWDAIAPYVEDGSYIEMQGEDGYLWRWVFENGRCREVSAKVSWE